MTDAISEQLSYEGCFDFVDGTNIGNDYAYNANGALTKDLNKGIAKIEYDLLGNPKKVTLSNSRSIEYVYSADGRRLCAIHKSKISSEKTDYVGSLILKNNKPEMYRFSGGYYDFKDDGSLNDSHYYIADYMGNNRMVVNASTDAVEQVNHYYAYGGIIGNLSSNEGLQEFKFGDKKLDRTYGLDLYDVEARQYDAITPWFTSIDPLAEKYYGISPYAYCAGDPVNCVDPDGKRYKTEIKDGVVIIAANYYCPNKESYESAQQAAKFWNDKSSQFTADGMPVLFLLTVVLETDNKTARMNANIDSSAGNYYEVVQDGTMHEGANSNGGYVSDQIQVVRSRSKTDTPAHEIGHSLGLIHEDNDTNNLMSPASSTRVGDNIDPTQIKTILNNSGKEPAKDYKGFPAGRGTNVNTGNFRKVQTNNIIKIDKSKIGPLLCL